MHNKRKKTCIIVLLSLIVCSIGWISYLIGSESNKTETYDFVINGDVCFDRLMIDYNEKKFANYFDNVEYDKKNDCYKTEEDKIQLKNISIVDDISFSFIIEKDEKVEVYNNNEKIKELSKEDSSFSTHNRSLNILKEKIENINTNDFVVLFVYLIVSSICVYLINDFIIKYKENKLKIGNYIIFPISIFMVYLLDFYFMLQYLKYGMIIPFAIFAIFIIRNLKKDKNNICNTFFVVATILYISMIFLIPPLHVPDETAHFMNVLKKSYLYSYNGDLTTKEVKQYDQKKLCSRDDCTSSKSFTYIPSDYVEFYNRYSDNTLNTHYKISAKGSIRELYKKANYNNFSNKVYWYGNTKYSNQFAYYPAIIVGSISRVLRFSPLLLFLICRFINAIICIFICFYSIKIIPKYRSVLLLVTLLPIFIHQTVGINVDSMTLWSCILFLSLIAKMYYGNTEKKDLVLLIISSLIINLTKFIYFPIFILLIPLFIKDKNKRNRIIYSLCLVSVIIGFSLIFFGKGDTTNTRENLYVSTYAFTHIKETFDIVLNTILNRLDLDYFRGYIDGFGWSIKWNKSLLLFMSETSLLCYLLVDEKKDKTTNKEKTIFLSIVIMISAIIYYAMLTKWTQLGSTSIDGLQPRYFLIPALLLYCCINNKYINIKLNNKNLFRVICLLIINAIALITIITGFYN